MDPRRRHHEEEWEELCETLEKYWDSVKGWAKERGKDTLDIGFDFFLVGLFLEKGKQLKTLKEDGHNLLRSLNEDELLSPVEKRLRSGDVGPLEEAFGRASETLQRRDAGDAVTDEQLRDVKREFFDHLYQLLSEGKYKKEYDEVLGETAPLPSDSKVENQRRKLTPQDLLNVAERLNDPMHVKRLGNALELEDHTVEKYLPMIISKQVSNGAHEMLKDWRRMIIENDEEAYVLLGEALLRSGLGKIASEVLGYHGNKAKPAKPPQPPEGWGGTRPRRSPKASSRVRVPPEPAGWGDTGRRHCGTAAWPPQTGLSAWQGTPV